MISINSLPSIDRIILLVAGCIIIVAGLRMAAWFIGPLLLSVFVAIVFSVLARWLMKKGLSTGVSNMIAFIAFLLCLALAAGLIILSVYPLLSQIPSIEQGIDKQLNLVEVAISKAGFGSVDISSANELIGSSVDLSKINFQGIIEGLSALLIVIFTSLLLLLEAGGFSGKLRAVLTPHPDILERVGVFSQILIDYVIIRTEVNLFTGIAFGLSLLLLGVQGALLWGLILFVLSYVPYVGLILALIAPTIIAFVQISPFAALLVVVAACIINLVAENFLFPQFAGRSMNLSPAVIFISILFWGFMFGGSGSLIAVPLTVLLKMVLEHFDETRWLAMLMGPSISQRLEEK